MSGVGQCWDNAPVESFFGSLKRELRPNEVFATRDQARAEIFEYLERVLQPRPLTLLSGVLVPGGV
jgi:hypothetical protein